MSSPDPNPSSNAVGHECQQECQKERRRQRLTLGQLGEDLAADWLQKQGGRILERRWRCRLGEIDLIALLPDGSSKFLLAFIEVKTRSRGSWDLGGMLSITTRKQQKLWRSAQIYLTQAPRYASLPCRFDIALIRSQKLPSRKLPSEKGAPAKDGQPVEQAGYQLTLQHYLADAFRLD